MSLDELIEEHASAAAGRSHTETLPLLYHFGEIHALSVSVTWRTVPFISNVGNAVTAAFRTIRFVERDPRHRR